MVSRTLEHLEARVRDDTGVHGPGAARLPVRDRAGDPRVRATEGAEGALRRPPRTRAIDVPGCGHGIPDDEGAGLVRLLPEGNWL